MVDSLEITSKSGPDMIGLTILIIGRQVYPFAKIPPEVSIFERT